MRLLFLLAAAFSSLVHAQPLPGGASLGMSLPELQQAAPALQRVSHPARLSGGLVGSWSAPSVDVGGVALTPTFYFGNAQLRRIEYLARDGGPASFASLLAWARSAWGTELASNAPEGAYASWDREDLQAYLQLTGAGRVRLVVRSLVGKDASEL